MIETVAAVALVAGSIGDVHWLVWLAPVVGALLLLVAYSEGARHRWTNRMLSIRRLSSQHGRLRPSNCRLS